MLAHRFLFLKKKEKKRAFVVIATWLIKRQIPINIVLEGNLVVQKKKKKSPYKTILDYAISN